MTPHAYRINKASLIQTHSSKLFPSTMFAVIWVVIVTSLTFLLYHRLKCRSRPPYPPGPKGLPILGNLFDFPKSEEWKTYDRWSKEFGTQIRFQGRGAFSNLGMHVNLGSDIVYASAAGNDVIILNSLEAVEDLLEKRSSNYSSRYVQIYFEGDRYYFRTIN